MYNVPKAYQCRVYTCKCVWQCQFSKTRSFTTVAAVVISFVWNSICICFRDAVRMHIRAGTWLGSAVAPFPTSCCSLQRTVQSSRRHFPVQLQKRRNRLPLPALASTCWRAYSEAHSSSLVHHRVSLSPDSAADDYQVIRTLWGIHSVSFGMMLNSTSQRCHHSSLTSRRALGEPAGSLQEMAGTRVEGAAEHTGFFAATSIQGTRTKVAKFTHVWIAEVKQSNIPSLKVQFFKVPNLWSCTCIYLRLQGHPVASAINHRCPGRTAAWKTQNEDWVL